MARQGTISFLVFCIAVLAIVAAGAGIFLNEGPGPSPYRSIRGDTVTIYGRGIYRHMSAEVAPQGIAQDYVTLGLGVPLLLISLFWARSGSLRGRFLLAGILGYFLVTYLFYLLMGMYNVLFLAYVALLSAAFFAFALTLLSFDVGNLPSRFHESTPVTITGGFLVLVAASIAWLWLSIAVPPLLDGTIVPRQVEHYTTLVVQGMDLAIFLPVAVVAGVLFMLKRPFGYLLAPTYLIFLAHLMTALTAKLIALAMLEYNVFPAIFVIPAFNLLSIAGALLVLNNIKPTESALSASYRH